MFSTGKAVAIAGATAAPQVTAGPASGVAATSGVATSAASAVTAASAPAASSVAGGATHGMPPLSPDLVVPALRETDTSAGAAAPTTLGAQVLQALSRAQPAPELPPRGRGNAIAPTSAPTTTPKDAKDTKPGNKPAPKPAQKSASEPAAP